VTVEAAKAKAIPLWKHYGWKGLMVPGAVVLVLLVVFVTQLNDHPPAKEIEESSSANATQAVLSVLQQSGVVVATTTPTTAKPPPDYDYLTCTHWREGEAKCVPLEPWPLTVEAKQLIGWQGGIRVNGVLSTDNTRDVADQIRRLPGVDACQMYLGLVQQDTGVLVRTVYANQQAATPGAVKLYDCTPKAGTAPVTVPTAGAA
jgi:hypothetical protein